MKDGDYIVESYEHGHVVQQYTGHTYDNAKWQIENARKIDKSKTYKMFKVVEVREGTN